MTARDVPLSSSLPANLHKPHKKPHKVINPSDLKLTQHNQQFLPNLSGSSQFPQLSRKFVARRISEGETGRLKEELKCQSCGKGYKHVSSLAKHLWEHTPEWSLTSKLLISKHQQVQLLEAASILVSMNEEDEVGNSTSSDSTPAPATDTSREGSFEPIDHIPILNSKPIHKSPNKHTRHRSIMSSSIDSLLSTSVLDAAHNPPLRRRAMSSYKREEEEDDGLQDPKEEKGEDVFGMEV